ncbi:MAG: RHS repeat-associated core domain-containing protein, partial [Chloroflexota bacterium]
QRLQYTYDAVGNIRDVLNGLYADGSETVITQLGPPPENNVPGPSQHAFSYDGHYRLTGGIGKYIDQKENRDFSYETDYAANGNLLEKRQVTTTTSTTGNGGGNAGGNNDSENGKKGNGSGTTGGTTDENTCESNTGSGGGSFNQDPETTYVMAFGDLEYATDLDGNIIHRLMRLGNRTYTYDANGNMTSWYLPCAKGNADVSRIMEWDAENRLTRIADDTNDTDYRYNAEGERTLERGPGGLNWFVNDFWRTFNDGLRYANIFVGEQLVASHRTSPAGPAPAACTDTLENPCTCEGNDACLVTDISQCDLTTRIFDPVTSTCQPKESRKIYFLHKDLQGSLRVATDEVGNVFQYMDYLPTGRPWVAGQSTIKDTPYLFAGGWTDTTYDLVNFGARWYDPREEGFLSPEPLLEDDPYAVVDDPSLLSAYTYAASNPLKFVDPDGQAPKVASKPFDLGKDYEKHQAGDISISVSQRKNRPTPKITFGGRYSNDAKGQALGEAFKKHADRAERFSTILSISTENGVRKIRVFGVTADKTKVQSKNQATPNTAAGQSGSSQQNKTTTAPSVAGAPSQPDAQTSSDQSPAAARNGNSVAGRGGAGAGAGGQDTGAGNSATTAPPPPASGSGSGQDRPSPPPRRPPPPPPNSPAAPGPANTNG